MRIGRRVIAFTTIFTLPACAVLGPVTDAGMEDAPYEACARFAEAVSPADQCVSVQVRPAGGRWQAFTGRDAVHIDTGLTFEEVTSDRRDPVLARSNRCAQR